MTTVVIARQFRNTRLFLTSAKKLEFTWSANRALAMPLSISVALRIMQECEDFARGTDAFAIDGNDCVIAHATNGAVKMLRPGGYRDSPLNATDNTLRGGSLIRFDTILKAAKACKSGSSYDCMCELGKQFESVPVLTLAEALLVCDRMSRAMYRNIERDGFQFPDNGQPS